MTDPTPHTALADVDTHPHQRSGPMTGAPTDQREERAMEGGSAHEPDYAAERRLPEGSTCADCQHGPRCNALFGAVRQRFTSCDFWPSRYRAQVPA